ncbi:FecR family protein [Pseudomonas tolaasii]|uniref:FecR domain-containing protein n=1 Tax=Pseudomonas tolaasii TaxID=29442 RepID=UPI0015A3C082|nr:FecR family protein [Pseudomonas tolaasii]NVZ44687.1 FecR family protein [Pseudomonas tolaasii]NWA47548.1 FecR family protein [Pseudomonas tolaasii]WLH50194.1 FecR family protein [Pseudomonas tolaasii]
MSHSVPDEAIIDEAAQWMALLQSGHASAQEHTAFRRWREGDPRRAEVFNMMGGGLAVLANDELRRMPRDSLLHTLNAPSGRRRFLRNTLALVGFVSFAGIVTRLSDTWLPLGALRTGTGERLNLTLEDGSALTLDARSRVVTHFDARQRLLQLLDGKLLVDVFKDSLRPFIVETEHGRMRALGTRFLVQQGEHHTHITMLHSQVEITTRDGAVQVINAGQKATFNAQGILTLEAASGGESAWTQGLLEVRDRSLGEVVEALRDYRRGIIRISPEAASLRLSGIFPLDDSQSALQLLAKSLPVQIDYHSPYWVSIERR